MLISNDTQKIRIGTEATDQQKIEIPIKIIYLYIFKIRLELKKTQSLITFRITVYLLFLRPVNIPYVKDLNCS